MQNWPEGYFKKVNTVLESTIPGSGFNKNGETAISFDIVNEDEAKLLKKKMVLIQKQLRQIRKQANYDIKVIRARYGDEIKSVEAGFISSVFGGAGRDRENKRRELRNRRDIELHQFQNVKSTIDKMLIQFDNLKIQIDEIIIKGEF